MPDNGGKRLKEEYETIDLLEILRLLKKNLLVILAVAILLAVAGYLVSAFAMTPQYEASATLIVNSREDQATTQVIHTLLSLPVIRCWTKRFQI